MENTQPQPAPAPEPEPTGPPPSEEPVTPAEPQPPITTPPPTEEPAVKPLFSGSRVSDFWLNQSAPGAVSEVADPLGSSERALKMTVRDTDVYPITPTENPRAELLSPTFIKSGDEFWLSTKFMIPTDMPSVPGWLSLVSVYGAPFQGSSPWHVAIDENKLRWQRNETYKYDTPWEASLTKGSWVTVLCHERFGSDGWIEMWINGKQITFFSGGTYNPNHVAATTKLGMKTMDSSNNGGPNYAKIMQYREVGMFQTGTVYFGSLKVGTTRTSVGA